MDGNSDVIDAHPISAGTDSQASWECVDENVDTSGHFPSSEPRQGSRQTSDDSSTTDTDALGQQADPAVPLPVSWSAFSPVANKADENYNMDHPKRGKALLLYQETFDKNLELLQRPDNEGLVEKLRKVLASLGFQVEIHRDLAYTEIEALFSRAAGDDHSECDCFLAVIMTHGTNDKLYSRDTHYNSEHLRTLFTSDRCPTLAGKPKLFIIQACRGNLKNSGTKLFAPITEEHSGSSCAETDGIGTYVSPSMVYRLPVQADFLIAYATIPHYCAYRTWFIEALCQVLSERGSSEDLLSIMTVVQRCVATKYEDGDGKEKQIPCIIHVLTRKIYFPPKHTNGTLCVPECHRVA